MQKFFQWIKKYFSLGLDWAAQSKQNLLGELKQFQQKIKAQEEQLFGLSLYFLGLSNTLAKDKNLALKQKVAYEKTIKEQEAALAQAKKVMQSVQQEPGQLNLISQFKFPEVKTSLAKKAKLLVRSYYDLFLWRSKDQPLSAKEIDALTEAAARQWQDQK